MTAEDDDYEHWPEPRSSPAHFKFEVIPDAVIEKHDRASHHSASFSEGTAYVYKPARTKSAPKPPPTFTEDGICYRYVPVREPKPKETEPEDAGEYVYVPAKSKRPDSKVWLGRTKAEIAEDNVIIAARMRAQPAPVLGPSEIKDEDLVWMKDSNNELTPLLYATVKHFDGQWKQYPDNPSQWYFIKA